MRKSRPMPAMPGRRRFLQGAGALAAGALASPDRAFGDDNSLRVNSWGGSWLRAAQEHLFDPFSAQSGIEVDVVSPVSFAKLAAQVRTGVYEFDVTTLGGGDLVRANNARLIEEIESPYEGGTFMNGVGSHAFATIIAWRTDKLEKGPQTWAEFWDVDKFPGTRCLQRHPARLMPIALLADGVPKDKLFPLDIDRAFKSLDRIKPHVRVWWTAGAQSEQLLRDGEVDVIGMWHMRYFGAEDSGAPVSMTWTEAQIDRAYWVVAKDTPSFDEAMAFIKFATSPRPLAGFATQTYFGALNPAAEQYIPDSATTRMPTAPLNYPKTFEQDMSNWGADPNEVSMRFEEWLLS